MNKMVVFVIHHSRFPDVTIKGLIDGDYLLDDEARQYAQGIIQYYQGDKLRWKFPANPLMKNSIKWNAFEELKSILSDNEEEFASLVFRGDKNQTFCLYEDMKVDREVLTW